MMATLYGVSVPAINQHLKNIFEDGELSEDSVIKNFLITAEDGKNYNTKHYNVKILKERGLPLPEPICKHMVDKIYELRPVGDRAFFAGWIDGAYVLLHCYKKQGQKTPPRELKKAQDEFADFMERWNQVVEVLAADNMFKQLDWLPADTEIIITFFKAQTEEEDIAAHPGMIRMPESSNKLIGRDYMDVTKQLAAAGFTTIMAESQPIRIALFTKEGSVAKVTVNDVERFEKGDWYYPDDPVRITYNTAAARTEQENK